MIALFRDKSIVAFFALVICTVLIHFHIFYDPVQLYTAGGNGFLNFVLKQYVHKLHPVLITISFILLLFLQAVRLNIILNNNKMYAKPNFAVAFGYIFLSGLMPSSYLFSAAFIANSLIILHFAVVLKFYNNQNAIGLLFNAGFLASLATICYYPAVILMLITLCGLAILRPFKVVEWFIMLIGLIAPFYLVFAILYLCDFNFKQIVIERLSFYLKFQQHDYWYFITVIAIAVLLLLSLINWYPNSNRLVIQIRKNWVVMLILLIASLIAITIYTKVGALPEVILLVPMSAFLANFFVYPRKIFWVNVVIFLTAIIIVYNNYILIK